MLITHLILRALSEGLENMEGWIFPSVPSCLQHKQGKRLKLGMDWKLEEHQLSKYVTCCVKKDTCKIKYISKFLPDALQETDSSALSLNSFNYQKETHRQ